MAATNYFENLMLQHALRQQPFVISNWYVGLWTANPTDAGLLTGEVSVGEYERQSVVWDASLTNDSDIDWPLATSYWGTVSYVCLINSPTKGTGNMLAFDNISSLFVVAGRRVTIPAGGLTVTAT